MASCSSSDHPELSHPYHANRSRLTTSLEKKEGRFSLRRLLPSSWREGLLPLPKGAHLSSSSLPPVLLTLPHMSLELPHPAHTPDSQRAPGDLMWAVTPDPSPQPPVTILGVTGTPLHHPQPTLLPMSFGTMSIFHTAPTSLPIADPPITKPHPQQVTSMLLPGIGTYRTGSSHLSLYQPSRNLSPAPQPPIFAHQDTATGRTSRSSMVNASRTIPHELLPGSDSPAKSSHSSWQSYSRPLSRNMDISQVSQAAQTPLSIYDPRHPSPHSSSMESPRVPSRLPSWCAITPINPYSHLRSTLHLYEQTRFDDILFPAPRILTQAEYTELYSYFAYELPFMPPWGETQAGNDYFMKKQQGLPANEILQYEAERNARLLFNELHPDAPMWTLIPYEEAAIETQELMPDEPPVAPPQTTIGTFSYIRGHEPPGTNTHGYRPFTGADPPGRPPIQPPPAPPIRWVLPRLSAPPKAPTPPVPWVLTQGATAPYDDFKPRILKEVDNFKGDSNDISQFFLKCELHFKLFNRHFRYSPHKVISCIS